MKNQKNPGKWAKYIKSVLKQTKISQAQLAKYCGVSRACVCLWVQSNRRPRIEALKDVIAGIARATGQTRGEATKAVCTAYLFDYGVKHVD